MDGLLQVRNRIYFRVFDQVWITANMPDAELRRQRKAFWKGVSGTAAAAAVLMCVGVAYWDAYWRDHIEYYAHFAKRWGMIEGVRRLSAQDVFHRSWTLKAIRRGRIGPVKEYWVVNGCRPETDGFFPV